MNLFSQNTIPNLLPYDGDTVYHGIILSPEQCNFFLHKMLEDIEWRNDEAVIFGRHIVTKRKVAWYGDEPYSYTYSNTTKEALPWTKELLELKHLVEAVSGNTFNSCLLNLYHSGEEGMAWHSDDEKTLVAGSSIASLSLGAERKFSMKHRRTGEQTSLILASGSLLEMKGATQTHWLHCVPKTKRVTEPRVNLTFRSMAQ
ncbi:MAG: alpha-ketoglutarate-dependent dioxygenase AlkB family protein [Chitinophagaceae bacterium]